MKTSREEIRINQKEKTLSFLEILFFKKHQLSIKLHLQLKQKVNTHQFPMFITRQTDRQTDNTEMEKTSRNNNFQEIVFSKIACKF